jgi:hypothetical protein
MLMQFINTFIYRAHLHNTKFHCSYKGCKVWYTTSALLADHTATEHLCGHLLFYEMGYGLFNLVQGGGRGGRSGQKANVIVMTSDRISEFHTGLKADDDVELMGLMVKWTHNTTECRRVIISETMDGIKVTCRDLAGAKRCDICRPDSETGEMIRKAVTNSDKPQGAIMPMEDIQDMISGRMGVGNEGGKKWDDDMDDMEFEEDDLILSLDLSTINTPTSTASIPSTTTSQTLSLTRTAGTIGNKLNMNPQKSNNRQKPLSAARIAGVTEVGMNVRVAGSRNMSMIDKKKQKSELINELGTTLRGYCAICWAWKGLMVKIVAGVEHKPFADCGKRDNCNGRLVWGGGPNYFASKIDFKLNHFCWHCGFPQDVNHIRLLPSCHPTPGRKVCEFKRMITHILFTIHQQPELWKMVKGKFGLGDEYDNVEKYTGWCGGYAENTANYWMGLEVVIWVWTERKNKRFSI